MLSHVVRAAQELQHSKVVIVASPQSGAAVQQVMTQINWCAAPRKLCSKPSIMLIRPSMI